MDNLMAFLIDFNGEDDNPFIRKLLEGSRMGRLLNEAAPKRMTRFLRAKEHIYARYYDSWMEV